MLKQRVITAIVLLAVLLPAMFYTTPVPFCAVALLLIAAGGWEWGRLNAFGSFAEATPGTPPISTPRPPYVFCRYVAPIWVAMRPATSLIGVNSGNLPPSV